MPGWQGGLTGIRGLEDRPVEARDYLDVVAELVGFPVDIVSVGPDREQTILVDRS